MLNILNARLALGHVVERQWRTRTPWGRQREYRRRLAIRQAYLSAGSPTEAETWAPVAWVESALTSSVRYPWVNCDPGKVHTAWGGRP